MEGDVALCGVQGNILLSIGSPKGLIVAADIFVVSHSSFFLRQGCVSMLHLLMTWQSSLCMWSGLGSGRICTEGHG